MRRRGSIKRIGPNRFRVWASGRDHLTGSRLRPSRVVIGDQSDAEAALAEILAQLDSGRPAPPKQLTLSGYLDLWLRDMVPGTVKPDTAAWYKLVVDKHLRPGLGGVRLMELTPFDIQGFYSRELQSLAPSTVRGHHRVLHAALEAAVDELIPRNPADKAKPPRIPRREKTVLPVEGFPALLELARPTRHYALILTALATGMRSGELCGLKWSDVDWGGGVITVRRTLRRRPGKTPQFSSPKTVGSSRRVQMTPALAAELKAHKARQNAERLAAGEKYANHGLIFAWEDGRPCKGAWANRFLQRLLEGAGLPRMHFHDLRRSATTALAEAGVNVKFIADLLGHDDVATTMGIYTEVRPAIQEEVARVMDDILAGRRRTPKERPS